MIKQETRFVRHFCGSCLFRNWMSYKLWDQERRSNQYWKFKRYLHSTHVFTFLFDFCNLDPRGKKTQKCWVYPGKGFTQKLEFKVNCWTFLWISWCSVTIINNTLNSFDFHLVMYNSAWYWTLYFTSVSFLSDMCESASILQNRWFAKIAIHFIPPFYLKCVNYTKWMY